jgi:Luciferase-like monooxygenase
MKFGLFYEHQLPQPWGEESELRLYQQALDQIELADRVGIDYVWEVEHHFLEEYSHSSAPEVFLAACSQRTKRIRLGHGITRLQSSGAGCRAHRDPRSGVERPRRVGHRRVGDSGRDGRLWCRPR